MSLSLACLTDCWLCGQPGDQTMPMPRDHIITFTSWGQKHAAQATGFTRAALWCPACEVAWRGDVIIRDAAAQ